MQDLVQQLETEKAKNRLLSRELHTERRRRRSEQKKARDEQERRLVAENGAQELKSLVVCRRL